MTDKELQEFRKALVERFWIGVVYGAAFGVIVGYIIKGWLG